ncbi:MAG: hypothetical protein V3S39_02460 [Thermodesulfobacteriota bacterium]
MRTLLFEYPELPDCRFNVGRLIRVDGLKYFFQDGSWLLIRPSGTEPVLRTYAEASDPDTVRELL